MKNISKLLSLIAFTICIPICVNSCMHYNYPIASDFSCASIENSYNNNLSGARMIFANNTLYCTYYVAEVWFKGVYAIDSSGSTALIPGGKTISDISCNPFLFNVEDNLLLLDGFTNEYSVIDYNENVLAKSDFNLEFWSTAVYMSDNLIIRFPPEGNSKIYVKVDGKDEFELYGITGHPVAFYPCDNILYVMNDYGWLYKTDINNNSGKCEYISELEDIRCNRFIECNDYLYIDCYENGMYRYSLKDGIIENISSYEISSLNSYNGYVYYSTKNGVFSCDKNGEIKKLTDLNAEEIYIFDTQWIYLYNTSSNIYRVAQDGSAIERVNINTGD